MTDARDHASAEQVCDLLEGLLPPAEAATVAAHLDGCADCAALRDRLEALPALLAQVAAEPAPPIPTDVAVRLDAALAVAAADRAAERAEPAGQRVATVVPLASARRTRVRQAFAGLVAAAAVVVGFVVVGDVVGGGGGHDGDSGDQAAMEAGDEAGGQSDLSTLSAPLARLTERSFALEADALLQADDAGEQGERTQALPGSVDFDAPSCATDRALAAADVPGTPGPYVLLEGEPVRLVTSGPQDATEVVAYGCSDGAPVERASAVVDLTD